MPIVELPPIRENPADYDKIEQEILKILREEVYIPLMAELHAPKGTLQNSKDDLLQAVQSGRIAFHRGKFSGKFTSTTSRELQKLGATWDRKTKSYSLPQSKITIELKQAIALSESRFSEKISRLTKRISDMIPEKIAKKLDLVNHFDTALFRLNKQISKNVEKITVPITLTADQRKRVAEEYTNNLQLYIKDFTKKETQKLRNNILEHAKKGVRYENLVKEIQDSYGVSQNKAKFLARQETKILMNKFKEVRYQSVGVDEYHWYHVVGSPDHPVRPIHKALGDAMEHGKKKIYRYSDPPIDDPNGSKHNPGENFGCRCYSRAVVRF